MTTWDVASVGLAALGLVLLAGGVTLVVAAVAEIRRQESNT